MSVAMQRRYTIGYLRRVSADGRRVDHVTFRRPLPVYDHMHQLIGVADGAYREDGELIADVTFTDVGLEHIPEAMNFGFASDVDVYEVSPDFIAMSGEIAYLIVGPHAWLDP